MVSAYPLNPLLVVEFGQLVAGPVTGMLLADQGAQVIRIETPGEATWRSSPAEIWHGGKDRRRLDPAEDDQWTEIASLIREADVVIDDHQPSVLTRSGLGPNAMISANPRLIYCRLPAFPEEDPRAAWGGSEAIVAAVTGAYRADEAPPLASPIPIPSMFAAFTAATAIVAALLARERDGLGQAIDVSLFDATYTALGCFALPSIAGEDPRRTDDIWGKGLYRCQDGAFVQLCTSNPRFLERLSVAAGQTDWLSAGYLDRQRLAADPPLRQALYEALTAMFLTRPAAAWEKLVPDLPLTMLRDTQTWTQSQAAREGGAVRSSGVPSDGSRPGAAIEVRPGGAMDDTAAALRTETSLPHDASPRTLPALNGCHVLDLSQVLAGPVAGRILAEYGAEVIKVNDPSNAPSGFRYHHDVNRGKRTALFDLKDVSERDHVLGLVDDADVVIHNFTRGVAERLGIGAADLLERRPGLVYAWVTAFGSDGPWAGKRGYEINAQAVSGMMEQMSRGGVPGPQPFLINDYGTGMLTAFGVMTGLLYRQRTHRGCRVDSSLARTATTLVSPWLASNGGQEEPSEGDAYPTPSFLRASDGWIVVVADEGDPQTTDDMSGHATDLSAWVAERDADRAAEALRATGVPAAPLRSLNEAVEDPVAIARGLIDEVHHSGVGPVRMTGPAARLARTPVRPVAAVGRAGEDTDDVVESGWMMPRP